MRILVIGTLIVFATVSPTSAVDFLGATLCTHSVNTSVSFPDDSPLTLLSVEVGKHGALVMLLEGKPSRLFDDVDDLMADLTGSRGVGTTQQLQWSGNSLTGYAKIIRKGNVALVVSTSDDCAPEPETAVAVAPLAAVETATSPEPDPAVPEPGEVGGDTAVAATAVAATGVAAVLLPTEVPETPPADETVALGLEGMLKHSPTGDGWVDVMGVVVNPTEDSYRLATFDVAFFNASDELICVDTISVSQLQVGRTRAFRDSMRCPDYTAGSVARISFEFAGGY